MILQDAFMRLAAAVLLGGLIGFERQWRNHYAGLRTNTLITIGSAAILVFAQMLPGADASAIGRIASQIITGVGFLCAGVIMHEGVNVKGLNTSATLWCSVGVGMFSGAGMFPVAALLTAFIIGTNLLLRPLVHYINNRTPISDELDAHYTVSISCHSADVQRIREAVSKRIGKDSAHLKSIENKYLSDTAQINAEFLFRQRADAHIEAIAKSIGQESGITAIKWSIG